LNKQTLSYYLFGLTLTLFQFAGYSAITLPLLALATLLIFNVGVFNRNLKTMPSYMLFLACSILIGLTFLIFRDTNSKSIMAWGQFYFFAFLLLGIDDKSKLIRIIKYFVYAIFVADLVSNILLAMGFSLPWTKFPPVRPGELLPRFPGVKSSSLYSGSISFLALCCIMQEDIRRKWLRYSVVFVMCLNLLLAGSFRYYITLMAVFALYYFHIYKDRRKLLLTYGLFVLGVIIMTATTTDISKSNELRWGLWMHTIDIIGQNPFFGEGFVFHDVREGVVFSLHNLAMARMTESTILLFAMCFGVPVMCLFLHAIYATLRHFYRYRQYEQELGFFLGLTLDLFWGGSIDNCMSVSILLLSMYLINYNGYIMSHAERYAKIPDRQDKDL
jgi:hypothetical protein